MLLYYHADPFGNFGDDLNPWLWKRIFPNSFTGDVVHDPKLRTEFDENATLFIGIGTLLNSKVPKKNPKIVLGAGVGYGDIPSLDSTWRILSVRGPLTAQRLGLSEDIGLVDPAVLVVDYAPFEGLETDRTVVSYMPHCGSARNIDWSQIAKDAGVSYIDPQWPVDRVLSALRKTRLLITEALHGAILAESYRIPWVPIKSSPGVLEFKWNDWCQSVGLKYQPTKLPPLWPNSVSKVSNFKNAVKRHYVVTRIRSIALRENGQLTENAIYFDKKEKLLHVVNRLQKELGGSGSSATAT